VRLVFDIETDGLLDTLTQIHCIVLKDIDTNEVFSFSPADIEQGLDLLHKADTIIGHNIINFDIPAIEKVYPSFETEAEILDTLVLSRVIKADQANKDFSTLVLPRKLNGSHSLKAWGIRLGLLKGDFGETTDWSRWSEDMQKYCEQDVEVTHSLWKHLAPQEWSKESITFEHQIAEVCNRIGAEGWTFNERKAGDLYSKLAQERANLEVELQTLFEPWEIHTEFIPKVNNKKLGYVKDQPFTKVKVVDFNPNSRKHIQFCLEKKYKWKPKKFTPSGDAQIDETILEALPFPEAKKLAYMFLLQKRIGQLAEGSQAWLRLCKDGVIRHNIISAGTVTLRAAHRYPNLAQVPSAQAVFGKECRELFTVPADCSLVGADLSGLELRCLAHFLAYSDKGAYAQEILNGDIHTTNQNAAGLDTRDQAKKFIYTLLYGGGDLKVGQVLGKGAKAGKETKEKFFKAMPSFSVLKKQVQVAAERGYLIGLTGERVHIRSAHAALNTLLQNTGSTISKKWVILIDQELRRQGLDAKIIAWVHDEVQIKCKKGIEDDVGDITRRMAKETGEFFKFKIPIASEYTIGNNWSETH
jgi:DNA polymerase I-like protein with 3'-5' exonuclease and polymerase domains